MDFRQHTGKLKDLFMKYRYVLLIILIGLIFMVIPSGRDGSDPQLQAPVIQDDISAEEKLSEILSHVQGAGEVEVLLTIDRGEEIVYQTNSEESNDSVRIETVVVSGSDRSETGLIRQINPTIYRGAIVVCKGADDPVVRLAIVDAVSKATGLGADKISVMKMK